MAGSTRKARPHLLARDEDGLGTAVAAEIHGAARGRRHLLRLHRRAESRPRARGLAARDLGHRGDAGIDQERGIDLRPLVEIGPAQIVERQDELPDMAPPIDGPAGIAGHRLIEAPHARFPIMVEGAFVMVDVEGPETLDAAQIMHPVHYVGPWQSAVPIMALRVTRPASASSSSVSLPAGRCGSTR